MDWIYEGEFKKGGRYKVRHLSLDDKREILRVQEEVAAQLTDKDSLATLSEEEFEYILSGKGLMLGVFAANQLIAFRALLVPAIDDEHLGWDIGLSEDELAKVIYQEISCVLPEFRGNGLQKILAVLIMEELSNQDHPYRYICCTVAPFNIPSLKDKFAQGMHIATVKEKYGGRLRYIFVLDLEENVEYENRPTIQVDMEDIETQKLKFSQGLRCIDMEEKEDGYWLYFSQ
ncbi:MAG: GNAT family N-acetyltransferase [Neobacillus sp.]